MIGIQVVSHGELCSGVLDSLTMIIGEVTQIAYVTLTEEAAVEDYQAEMLAQSQALNQGQGVLVFADMYGATPYNTALLNSQKFTDAEYQVVAGFNLPLIIEAVLNRENMSLVELVTHLQANASESIVFPESVTKELIEEEER